MPNPKLNHKYLMTASKFFTGFTLAPVINELLGDKFTDDAFLAENAMVTPDLKNMTDTIGQYGDIEINPYADHISDRHLNLANTKRQQQYVSEKNQYYKNLFNEVLQSGKLDQYKGIKSFAEMTAGYVNDAANGIDSYSEMLKLPSAQFVNEFPDWIFDKDPAHSKSVKEIDDMLVGMGYADLWQEMTSRAKLELEIKDQGDLSEEQQKEYRDKLIASNNRMIGVFEKQTSAEAEARYADFYKKYDYNVKGQRGVHIFTDKLAELNEALESGWDVKHYKAYQVFRKLSDNCRNSLEFIDQYDAPELENFRELSRKVAENDPTGKKFANAAECEAYVKQYGADLQNLLFEAKKPEVSKKLGEIVNNAYQQTLDYQNYDAARSKELKAHEKDPGVQVRPEIPKPEITKYQPGICSILKDGEGSIDMAWYDKYAGQLNPESMEIAQREYDEYKRERKLSELSKQIKTETDTLMPEVMEGLSKKASFYQIGHKDSWAFESFRDRTRDLDKYLKKSPNVLSVDENLKNTIDPEFREKLLLAYKASVYYQNAKRKDAGIAEGAEWEGPSSPMGRARYEAAQKIEQLARKYIMDDIVKDAQAEENKALDREQKNRQSGNDGQFEDMVSEESKAASDALRAVAVEKKLREPFTDYSNVNRTAAVSEELAQILAVRVVADIYQNGMTGKIDLSKMNAQEQERFRENFRHDISVAQKEIMGSADFNLMVNGLKTENGKTVVEPLDFDTALRISTVNNGRSLANRLGEYRKKIRNSKELDQELARQREAAEKNKKNEIHM